jgi:murein peptide amidase A
MNRFFRHAMIGVGLALCGTMHAFAESPKTEDLAGLCKKLTPRLPQVSVAMCQASGLKPTGVLSIKGFPILARHFPVADGNNTDAKPLRILLLGGIHGDELTASSIVFQWMQWMQTEPAQDFSWSVVPVLNPDGLLAPKPKRGNANNVDLNRNFPTPGWQQEAARYWVKATGSDPRRFPGTAPLSEPESRWVNDEMIRFRPQVIISVHAPFGLLDFDGRVEPPSRFGRLLFNRVGVYPGSLGNYGGIYKNVPVVTIELPNAQAMPTNQEVQRIWQDMLTWIRQHIPPEQAADVLATGSPVMPVEPVSMPIDPVAVPNGDSLPAVSSDPVSVP